MTHLPPQRADNELPLTPECINLDWEEWNGKGSIFHHMIGGSCAGVAEHLTLYPIDTLKTQLQFKRSQSNHSVSITSFIRQQGFFRLWRGSLALFSGCIPAHAAYFSIFEFVKKTLSKGSKENVYLAISCAGIAATFAHDLIITPMDVCKQRLQLGYYSSLRRCVKEILRKEGLRAFYLSLPTTLAIQVPYACVMTVTNESLKQALINYYNQQNIGIYLFSGGVAGALAAAVTTPFDVVKTRLQTQGVPTSTNVGINEGFSLKNLARKSHITNSHRSFGFTEIVRDIYKEQSGCRGFFKGMYPRIIIHAPSVAISWTVYELIQNAFLKDR